MDLANAEKPTVTRDVGLSAGARINKLTNNRTPGVQAGTQAYRECARAAQEMEQARLAMEAMKPEIEANKLKDGLKKGTLKLLDILTEAGEIKAAFAVTPTASQGHGYRECD